MKGVCWPDPLADSPLSTARRKITSSQREFPHSPWNQDITRLLETGLARELPPSGLLAVSWLCPGCGPVQAKRYTATPCKRQLTHTTFWHNVLPCKLHYLVFPVFFYTMLLMGLCLSFHSVICQWTNEFIFRFTDIYFNNKKESEYYLTLLLLLKMGLINCILKIALFSSQVQDNKRCIRIINT